MIGKLAVASATVALGILACDAAGVDASYWDRNPAEGAAAPAPASSSSAPEAPDAEVAPDAGRARTCLQLQLTTKSYVGHYAPDNVGAIWITRADGTFVRTLEAWGTKRLRNAVAWRKASQGNVVDAITGATRQAHGTHTASWACEADGAYVVHVELTEEDSAQGEPAGPHREIAFDTSVPGDVAAADDATYTSITATVPTP